MQARRVVRSLFTGLFAVSIASATAFAQDLPFDITDPTPRDVYVDIEAINTIAVIDGVVNNGGGADPVTEQPNPLAIFGYFGLIRGTWSVVGSTGTIAISQAEIESFVNAKFSPAFITAVPGSFTASEIIVDTTSGEASWAVVGEVTAFGVAAPFGSLAQTASGPYTFDDPIFVGTDFEGDVVPGATTGIDVRAPGISNFCTESFNNYGTLTECGGSGSLAFGYGESYPYIADYGLIRMTGPVGVAGAGIYNGFFAFDLGDHKWTETCGDGTVDPGEECDDGNNDDGDCCTAQCTFEPVGSPCDGTGAICTTGECDGAGNCNDTLAPDGTVCSDDDSCTVGDECLSGVCESGPREPADCGDSKLCYKAKTSKNTAKFPTTTVTVDAVESASYDLAKPLELCAPADDDDSGAVVADAFALSYKLKRSKGEPKHQSIVGIQVADQLGTLSVDTIKEDRLFVPSGYALDAAATELPAGTEDHFLCYKVKISKGTPKFPRGVQVTLDVGSTSNRVFDVKKPTKLCFVADKNSEGVSNQNQNLMCYLVKKGRDEAKYERVTNRIHTADQFGDLRFDTITERELCIPAVVQLPAP